MKYRIKFEIDDLAEFEESNGERRPLTEEEYKENPYNDKTGRRIGYPEYRRYYGNPDRHVYLSCILETQCEHCGCWKVAESLSNIDMMDDDPDYLSLDLNTWKDSPEDFEGYMREVAKELVAEIA